MNRKPLELELGQALFGNPAGEHSMPEFVAAFFLHIRMELDRVFWNINQRQREDQQDPEFPGIEWRRYWWGDEDAPEAALPNFAFDGVEIRWYKHPGRGMTVNVDWDERQWRVWLDKCLAHIRSFDWV